MRSQDAASGQFLVLSDVHLDLFYDAAQSPSSFCRDSALESHYNISSAAGFCDSDDYDYSDDLDFSLGKFGCDTPRSLVISTLTAMREACPDPDFILLGGDLSAHCQPSWESTYASVAAATDFITAQFPNTTVLPLIGNNDLFPHNSLPLGPTELLSDYAALWQHWLDPVAEPGYAENLALAGYYTALPVQGLRVISLNTMYYNLEWCPYNTTDCDSYTDLPREIDPMGQFAWLQEQLAAAEAAEERVLIQGHISLGRSRGFDDLWFEPYQLKFLHILDQYSEVVEALFFSHTHRDEYILFLAREGSVMHNLSTMFVNSAVSPRSDNNPSFRVMFYEPSTHHLLDYAVSTLNLTDVLVSGATSVSWEEEYQFTTEYTAAGIDKPDMLTVYEEMIVDEDLFQEFVWNWGTRSPLVNYDKHSEQDFICSISCVTNSAYNVCSSFDDDN